MRTGLRQFYYSCGLLALMLQGGCSAASGPTLVSHQTPAPMNAPTSRVWPMEIEYQLLGTARGQACRDIDNHGFRKQVVNEVIQAARYQALSKVPEAENLVMVRTRIERDGAKVCALVAGRAYRTAAMRSMAPSGSSSPEPRSREASPEAEQPGEMMPGTPGNGAPSPAITTPAHERGASDEQ